MNLKYLRRNLFNVALIFLAAHGALAGNFILKNSSSFDTYSRCRSNAEAAANMNFDCTNQPIKSGDSIQLSLDRNYSIITAGTSKLMKVSQYYDVPKPNDLAREKLSANQYQEYVRAISRGCLPVVTITSGITYGWNFGISYTCI